MPTAQHYQVTVTINGEPFGTFDTLTGGEVTAEITKDRPGGMAPEVTDAALPTIGDVTVGRRLERERDVEANRRLNGLVGKAKFVASKQHLDEDGNPWGRPTIYTGRLSGVTDPDVDSNSSDVSRFELTAVITQKA